MDDLFELKHISQHIGNRTDYIQGPGGNTSVKFADDLMAIKASGFELSEVTEKKGFAVVNHSIVNSYLLQYSYTWDDSHDEIVIAEFIRSQVDDKRFAVARPSMETGFHSLLKKFVIHSHSVYANIIGCSTEGKGILKLLRSVTPRKVLFIPYHTPGAALTIAIRNLLKDYSNEFGLMPDIILLENHGLIATTDDARECLKIHEEFNDAIREYFKISKPQLISQLEQTVSGDFFASYSLMGNHSESDVAGYSFKNIFFPDQAIFLADNISYTYPNPTKKICFNFDEQRIYYNASYKESKLLNEFIQCILFIYSEIVKNNLTPQYLSLKARQILNDMESEKFRKDQLK